MPLDTPSENTVRRPPKREMPLRILLVDDDNQLLKLYARFLISSGYHVDTAADGAHAWKSLQDINYDLLITDNKMPKVTGMELIKKLRSENLTLPVILASGAIPMEELNRHPELQLDATLPKPFTGTELLDLVKKVLGVADSGTRSAQLFKDFAKHDNQISQVKKPANAPIRSQINPPRCILVVDDDNDTRQLSVDVLLDSGYDVEGAKDGATGWKALQDNTNYDLVITDNKMPNMTGLEMITKLRSAGMRVRVIMATGILPMKVFAHNPWLQPDAMLQRPFTNDKLLETVRKVLQMDDGGGGAK
jgi:DNA-binding response OmpR family regulator